VLDSYDQLVMFLVIFALKQ